MASRSERVESLRAILAPIVRLLGFVVMLTSLLPLMLWIIRGATVRNFFLYEYHVGPIVSFLLLLIVGSLVYGLANRIACRLVPFQAAICPKCNYRLDGTPVDRCPECGLYLGPDFMDPPVPSDAPPSPTGELSRSD